MGSKYRARRNRLWIAQNGICAYCKNPCIPLPPYKEMQGATHPPNVFTTEHIVPVRRGGTEDPENLIGACLKCNMRKDLIDRITEFYGTTCGSVLERAEEFYG